MSHDLARAVDAVRLGEVAPQSPELRGDAIPMLEGAPARGRGHRADDGAAIADGMGDAESDDARNSGERIVVHEGRCVRAHDDTRAVDVPDHLGWLRCGVAEYVEATAAIDKGSALRGARGCGQRHPPGDLA